MIQKGPNSFNAEEFMGLIESVGWATRQTISLDGLEMAIKSSTQMYGLRDSENQLIAMARVLSDNYLFSTIPEILVHENHQKKGLGKIIMEEIKKDFGHTILYFGAQKGNEEFFEKLGFDKGMQSYSKKFKKGT